MTPRLTVLKGLLAALPWLVAAACGPALAESLASTAASSASSGGSASVGSLSDSVQGSSRSSAADHKVAEGEYRVADVVALADAPDRLQLLLRPAQAGSAEAPTVVLRLPRQVLEGHGLAAGDTVRVRHRSFGLEFARRLDAGRLEPFYLALADDWLRDLQARPLSL
jgi:hypothetical protein